MNHKRKPPPDHKVATKKIQGPEAFSSCDWQIYIDYLQEEIKSIKEDMSGVDIMIDYYNPWDDYSAYEYSAVFFVPMSEYEIQIRNKNAQKRKAAAEKRKEKELEKEKKEYERLKKKFEN